jgi:hypothetical protein
VLLLPPAPAALVDDGRALASLSFWSAAARRRIAVLGPPGGVGELGRAEGAPGELTGEEERGEDYFAIHQFLSLKRCFGEKGSWRGGHEGGEGSSRRRTILTINGPEEEVKTEHERLIGFKGEEGVCTWSCVK